MSQSNLQTLSALPDDVLCEVVREAEKRLDAQLATANAADQRAMSWAAILVTGAVAVTGGSAALLSTGQNLAISAVGICVAGVLGFSIWYAIMAVRPKEWHLPGNRPANWVPDQWQCYGSGEACDLRQASLEQAATLDEQIVDNAEAAREAGADLRWSMDLALIAVVFGVIAVGLLLLAQAVLNAKASDPPAPPASHHQ